MRCRSRRAVRPLDVVLYWQVIHQANTFIRQARIRAHRYIIIPSVSWAAQTNFVGVSKFPQCDLRPAERQDPPTKRPAPRQSLAPSRSQPSPTTQISNFPFSNLTKPSPSFTSHHGSTMPSSSIHLYAELLLHIRQITLIASLQTHHTATTQAVLSTDRETLVFTHDNQTARIRLPSKITGGGSAALQLPAAPPAKQLTLRLRLDETSPGFIRTGSGGVEDGGAENAVPWGAGEMGRGNRKLECRVCGRVLVNKGQVTRWLDLPSENWAEMMDFWHCHKPAGKDGHGHGHGQEDDDGTATTKGYGAANKLRAVPGTGFVDVSYFLLSEQDCCGVKVGPLSTTPLDRYSFCASNLIVSLFSISTSSRRQEGDLPAAVVRNSGLHGFISDTLAAEQTRPNTTHTHDPHQGHPLGTPARALLPFGRFPLRWVLFRQRFEPWQLPRGEPSHVQVCS